MVEVEHAHLTAQLGHVLNDLIGLGLPDAEIVFLAAIVFQQLDESFHGKRIVLGRDAELMLDRSGAEVFFFNELHLGQHLPGIA